MIFDIRHITEIRYEAPIRLARFNLRLRPAAWPGQQLSDYQLTVQPSPSSIVTEEGPYIVNSSRLTLNEPIRTLRIESRFAMDVTPAPLPALEETPRIRDLRQSCLTSRNISKFGPAPYLYPSRIAGAEPEIAAWAAPFLENDDRPVGEAAVALMHALFREFRYDSALTQAETAPLDAFHQRGGVCQDFAHILIIALRSFGLPAAYASGYLRTIPPPGKERLVGADATHAWVHLWCGEAIGWIGLDPTNNLLVDGDHIFTAMGRDYADVAPVDGVFYGGSGQEMQVSVDVAPRSATPPAMATGD